MNEKTFCILPYIHHHIDVKGTPGLCCIADGGNEKLSEFGNAEYVKIRKLMAEGTRLKECHRCWTAEEQNRISHRQKNNNKWRHIIPELYNKQILSVDYRFSNHCNFACAYCTDGESSKWGVLLGKTNPVTQSAIDIDTANLKYVYLAGGEPLLIPAFRNFCKSIKHKDKTELVINTNLSRIDDEWISILSEFNVKCLNVSVDSYGELGAYMRWPMDWNKFADNVAKVKNNNIPIMFNTLMCNINYLDLDALLDWMHPFDPVAIMMYECVDPKHFNLDLLKKHHPTLFAKATQKFLEHPLTQQHEYMQNFLQSQLDNIYAYDKDVQLTDTLDFMATQNQLKNTKNISEIKCKFSHLFLS